MQKENENKDKEELQENVLTQGKVIKVVEELEFGVLETEDSDFLFFHISNFNDDINISDIKEGDLVLCNKEIQKSDGKKAAINCQRVEFKGYLKDYFIEKALTAPNDVKLFDEFCENAREYARYLVEADIHELEELRKDITNSEEVIDLKKLRPKLAEKSNEFKDNKTFVEFIDILDNLIAKIDPDSENNMDMKNFKSFIQILSSYTKFL